jgi:hypothetical protein
LLLIFISTGITFAQEAGKTISITVSGTGKTQEEAKQVAIRSAIEQTLGTFISSKTDILNDSLFYNKVTSFSSGCIKSYNLLNSIHLIDSNILVTLRVLINFDTFSNYFQNTGLNNDFKLSSFALNFKQHIINDDAEFNMVYNMIGYLHEIFQISFDISIKCNNPKSVDDLNKNWEIPIEIKVSANNNMDFSANYFLSLLNSIALTNDEILNYKNLNKSYYPIIINYKGISKKFYLRNIKSIYAINTLTSNWEFYLRSFKVYAGSEEIYCNSKGVINRFSKCFRNRNMQAYLVCGCENYELDSYNIDFPTSGEVSATFSWNDNKLFSQIEKLSNYKVIPKGILSRFKFGGYVVYENNGHGLIASLIDIGSMDWETARKSCDELVLNGYSDWYLPKIEDLKSLSINLKQQLKGGFLCRYITESKECLYWSSSEEDLNKSIVLNFEILRNGPSSKYKEENYNVRPVRFF